MRTIRPIVGLDLSLRGAAAVFIPVRWTPGDWSKLKSRRIGLELPAGASHLSRVDRLTTIADVLVNFAVFGDSPIVYVEDYAYGLAAQGGMRIAELGGVVKAAFARKRLEVTPVNISTARKLFLGKLPSKGSAVVTHKMLREMQFPFETSDEGDAFVVANWALESLGRTAISCEGHTQC